MTSLLSVIADTTVRTLAITVLTQLFTMLMQLRDPGLLSRVWRIVLVVSFISPLLLTIPGINVPAPDFSGSFPDFGVTDPITNASVPTPRSLIQTPSRVQGILFGLSCIYCGGVLYFAGSLLTGLFVAARLRRHARPVLVDRAGLRIRSSDCLTSPVVFGNTILLPAHYTKWPEAVLEQTLTHEEAHIRHNDFEFLLLSSINRAIFWFNPAVWWLHRKLATLAEFRSDDAVLNRSNDSTAYARTLLNLAAKSRLTIPLAMANTQTVTTRVQRMLSRPTSRSFTHPAMACMVLAFVLVMAAVMMKIVMIRTSSASAVADQTTDMFIQRRYEQARPRRSVSLDPSAVIHWCGDYRASPVTVLTVSAENGHLFAQYTGQTRFEVFPDKEGELFYTVIPAQLSSFGSKTRPAASLVIHQNGVEHVAPRIGSTESSAITRHFMNRRQANVPQPGSANALTRILAPSITGLIDETGLSDTARDVMRARMPFLGQDLISAGSLRSIVFKGVGEGGWDLYEIHFQHSVFGARVLMAANGKIDGLYLSPLP